MIAHWYRRWRVRRRLRRICRPWVDDQAIWREWSVVVLWRHALDVWEDR